MVAEIKKAREDNKSILSFIKTWQSKNDYNPLFMDEYNAKFNKEFNHFLDNSNFSDDTIKLFKN